MPFESVLVRASSSHDAHDMEITDQELEVAEKEAATTTSTLLVHGSPHANVRSPFPRRMARPSVASPSSDNSVASQGSLNPHILAQLHSSGILPPDGDEPERLAADHRFCGMPQDSLQLLRHPDDDDDMSVDSHQDEEFDRAPYSQYFSGET